MIDAHYFFNGYTSHQFDYTFFSTFIRLVVVGNSIENKRSSLARKRGLLLSVFGMTVAKASSIAYGPVGGINDRNRSGQVVDAVFRSRSTQARSGFEWKSDNV